MINQVNIYHSINLVDGMIFVAILLTDYVKAVWHKHFIQSKHDENGEIIMWANAQGVNSSTQYSTDPSLIVQTKNKQIHADSKY